MNQSFYTRQLIINSRIEESINVLNILSLIIIPFIWSKCLYEMNKIFIHSFIHSYEKRCTDSEESPPPQMMGSLQDDQTHLFKTVFQIPDEGYLSGTEGLSNNIL